MSADKDEMDDMADLRFELDAMRERAEKAEAQLASITGVTRLELVAAEREACAKLCDDEEDDPEMSTAWKAAAHHLAAVIRERAAIAAAEAAP